MLSKDAGECAICLEELQQGDTIARLPCLCIYHKGQVFLRRRTRFHGAAPLSAPSERSTNAYLMFTLTSQPAAAALAVFSSDIFLHLQGYEVTFPCYHVALLPAGKSRHDGLSGEGVGVTARELSLSELELCQMLVVGGRGVGGTFSSLFSQVAVSTGSKTPVNDRSERMAVVVK